MTTGMCDRLDVFEHDMKKYEGKEFYLVEREAWENWIALERKKYVPIKNTREKIKELQKKINDEPTLFYRKSDMIDFLFSVGYFNAVVSRAKHYLEFYPKGARAAQLYCDAAHAYLFMGNINAGIKCFKVSAIKSKDNEIAQATLNRMDKEFQLKERKRIIQVIKN